MTTENLTPYAINEIAELTREGMGAQTLEFNTAYLLTDSNGNQHVHVTDDDPTRLDKFKENHVHGGLAFHDPDSFLEYIQRHAIDDTEIWADMTASRLTAVLDAPGVGKPRPAAHRAYLSLVKTQDWKDWTGTDRLWQSQEQLAQFIEDHFGNFRQPTAVKMLEIAQKFDMTKRVKYKSHKRLETGEVQFTYEEHLDSKGGGQYKIPETLKLSIQVFEHTPPQDVSARLHYRVNRENELQLKLLLDRPQDVEKVMFENLANKIAEGAATLIPAPHWYFGTAREDNAPIYIR